jgi:hypothetical protein
MQPRQRSNSSTEQHRRQKLGSVDGRCLALAALLIVLAATRAFAQLPPSRFSGGFPRPGQPAQGSPEELSAYQAAVSQQNPADRVSAIQQFLESYPASGLRQSAISALLATQHQMQAGQNAPAMPERAVPTQSAPVAPASSAPTAGPQRDSLLQQSAKLAQISIAAHRLEIKADNSALSQILHDISGTTGMKVDGLSKDERIFGTYGPGDARDVLLALLEGSGYNVLMVGDLDSGAPRELNLTQRGAAVASSVGSAPRRPAEEEADEDQDLQPPPQPEPIQPPQNNEPPQGQRTPQEILQELQRLRQQNQNLPPPQNPQ